MLRGSTVCILGLGSIGGRIAGLFKAFGARVYGTSDHRAADVVVDRVFRQAEALDAAEEADIVICALPLTPETRGRIDREFLAALKPGTLLVNVSRAAVIEEDALYAALQSGQIGGFAADVWWNAPKRGESESWPSTHNEFQNMENVVMSPHRAGFIEGSLPHLDGAVENISALIRGEALQNLVDRSKAY
jgi:phosphoglycerate dehydrogenase-like enzyme